VQKFSASGVYIEDFVKGIFYPYFRALTFPSPSFFPVPTPPLRPFIYMPSLYSASAQEHCTWGDSGKIKRAYYGELAEREPILVHVSDETAALQFTLS